MDKNYFKVDEDSNPRVIIIYIIERKYEWIRNKIMYIRLFNMVKKQCE